MALLAACAATQARAQASVPVLLGTRDPSAGSMPAPVITRALRPSAAAAPATRSPAASAARPAAAPATPAAATRPTRVAAAPTTRPAAAPATPAAAARATPAAAAPAARSAAAAPGDPRAAAHAAPPPRGPHAAVRVRGLHGTLNQDDVHQTMDAQQAEIDRCIEQARRRLRWLSGEIRFSFRVAAEGRVAEVHPTFSSVGHRELERCLRDLLLATQFPRPAGGAEARFNWGMQFEPANGRTFADADPKPIARALHKHARTLFRSCEIRRGRNRFQITAYVSRGGRLLSAGAVPVPARAEDKVDCVVAELLKWRLPKRKRAGKLSFVLR